MGVVGGCRSQVLMGKKIREVGVETEDRDPRGADSKWVESEGSWFDQFSICV